jgi:hypothetical protein
MYGNYIYIYIDASAYLGNVPATMARSQAGLIHSQARPICTLSEPNPAQAGLIHWRSRPIHPEFDGIWTDPWTI